VRHRAHGACPCLFLQWPDCCCVINTTLPLPVLRACSKSGHFRTPNPIVPGTAMCVPCEGCGTAQCGANGCTACPNAVLNKRIAHPWGLTGMDGKAAMVCRNASNSVTVRTAWLVMRQTRIGAAALAPAVIGNAPRLPGQPPPVLRPAFIMHVPTSLPALQPFKSRTGLLNTAIWPAPEFGGCPVGALWCFACLQCSAPALQASCTNFPVLLLHGRGARLSRHCHIVAPAAGLGDFKINWWEGDQTSDITVAKWLQWCACGTVH